MSAQILTSEELAQRWDRRVQWVREHAATGHIPGAFKVGELWRFPVEAVETYERRRSVADPLTMTALSAKRQAS